MGPLPEDRDRSARGDHSVSLRPSAQRLRPKLTNNVEDAFQLLPTVWNL